jgi:Na+-transporting methylmalonyl-CoA/oxaloacetate decarboxylase gamma subunit
LVSQCSVLLFTGFGQEIKHETEGNITDHILLVFGIIAMVFLGLIVLVIVTMFMCKLSNKYKYKGRHIKSNPPTPYRRSPLISRATVSPQLNWNTHENIGYSQGNPGGYPQGNPNELQVAPQGEYEHRELSYSHVHDKCVSPTEHFQVYGNKHYIPKNSN